MSSFLLRQWSTDTSNQTCVNSQAELRKQVPFTGATAAVSVERPHKEMVRRGDKEEGSFPCKVK